jgi:hypothetical protein
MLASLLILGFLLGFVSFSTSSLADDNEGSLQTFLYDEGAAQ